MQTKARRAYGCVDSRSFTIGLPEEGKIGLTTIIIETEWE